MQFNARLCKEALGKNYWRKLISVLVFSKNCASNFFLERWERVEFEM
jgi:hypothetical protein